MKRIVIVVSYLLFTLLALCTAYLYSIRCNNVPWGNSLRDGLYFLAYLMIILPAMLVLSVIRFFLWKRNDYIRFSCVLYTLITLILAILYNYDDSQVFVTCAMIICFLIGLINFVELFTVRKVILAQ